MAQRQTPRMVPLAQWQQGPEIPPEPANWTRRGIIGAGIAIAAGGLIAGIAWLQRVAGGFWERNPEDFTAGGAGPRGKFERGALKTK